MAKIKSNKRIVTNELTKAVVAARPTPFGAPDRSGSRDGN